MAYQADGQIDAKDYNETLVGLPTPLANIQQQFNAIWSTGKGNVGWGQPSFGPAVAPGQIIGSYEWSELARYIIRAKRWIGATSASWPGDPISPIVPSRVGDTVALKTADSTDFVDQLSKIYKYRMSCYQPGGGLAPSITNSYTWRQQLTFTVKLTFPSEDKLRYFFNCGGHISMNFDYTVSSTRSTINMIKKLASDIGTIYWTCTAGSQQTYIGDIKFDQVSKFGGGGKTPTLAKVDYYDPSLYDATGNGVMLFQQYADGAAAGYGDTNIAIYASTTGVKGANSGNGNIVTLKLVVDLDPDVLGGYLMPADVGKFNVNVIQPYLPLTGWSGSTGTLLYLQSWSLPSTTSTVLAI